jgi:flagellar motor switch protein FliN
MTRRPRKLPKLSPGESGGAPLLELRDLADLSVRLEVPLGKVELDVRELLELGVGAVLPLDRLKGEPLDVLANDTPIAEGEVRLQGERIAIRITQIRGAGTSQPLASPAGGSTQDRPRGPAPDQFPATGQLSASVKRARTTAREDLGGPFRSRKARRRARAAMPPWHRPCEQGTRRMNGEDAMRRTGSEWMRLGGGS